MSKGLSKRQRQILYLLKKRGEEKPRFPWMSTREIVMALRPEVQEYLKEKRRYHRIARDNMMSSHLHEMYLEHRKRLEALPNYHTARTSINKSLRNLVKRGLVARQEYWGMFQHEGVEAGWLLVENMKDEFKEDPEMLELRRTQGKTASKLNTSC